MTDAALWSSWRTERDPDAFAQIAARYAGLVFGTCCRVLRSCADAEDVAQECFLELLRVDLPPPQSLGPFLHTLAVRRALDFAKRERRRAARETRFAARRPAGRDDPAGELIDDVDAAIAALPDELRVPLVARFLEGQTFEAVAGRLDVPESTARDRVRRAIEAVRTILARRGVTVPAAALAAGLGTLSAEAAPPALVATIGKLALAGAAVGPATALTPHLVLSGALAMKKVQLAALFSVLVLLLLGTALVSSGLLRGSRSREAIPGVPVADRGAPPRDGELGGQGQPGAGAFERTAAGAAIQGVVRDAESGVPLAGASLRAGGLEAPSDAAGRYSLAGLRAGPVELAVSLRGFVAARSLVDLQSGAAVTLDLALEPALEVLAVDAGGARLPGVEVFFHELAADGPATREGAEHGPFTTGPEGTALVATVPRRRTDGSWTRAVFARRGGDAMLTGLAVEHLSPPAGAPPGPAAPIRVVLTPSILVAGRVEVPPGHDPRRANVSVLALSISDPRSPFGPSLSRSGKAGERPWARLFEARPAADGRFELAWVPRDAAVTAQATGPGLGEAILRSEDPGVLGALLLRLSPEGAIEGRMTYEGADAPAAGWQVLATPTGPTAGRGSFEAEVGADGRFRFAGLSADAYELHLAGDADRSAWTLAAQESVLVRSGETVRGIELRLERGATVRGRVTEDASGEPAAGVWVSALQGQRGDAARMGDSLTGPDGAYTLRLPRGRSRLYLSSLPRGFRRVAGSAEREIEIVPGDGDADGDRDGDRPGPDFVVARGEEQLPSFLQPPGPPGKAAGRVVDAAGAPLEGVAIEAHRQWQMEEGGPAPPWINPTHRAFTGPDGRYEVVVGAGKPYRLLASGREVSTAWSEIFRAGEESPHIVPDFRLLRGTSSLEGTVVDPDGRPVEGATLYAARSKRRRGRVASRRRRTRTAGSRIDHLLEGETVRLRVVRAGYEPRDGFVAPGALDLRLVIHPGAGPEGARERSVPDPRDLIGRRAPPWGVERWVREPAPPALLDRPERPDGKITVVVLCTAASDGDASRKQIEALEAICARRDAFAVVIFSSAVHESAAAAALSPPGQRVAVGIDRHVPGGEGEGPGSDATSLAYGYGGSPTIFLVAAGGMVTHAPRDLEALEAALAQ